MGVIADQLRKMAEEVNSLEEEVRGSSPIRDQIAIREDALKKYAQELSDQTVALNQAKQAHAEQVAADAQVHAERDAKMTERETKLEAAKAALKAQAPAPTEQPAEPAQPVDNPVPTEASQNPNATAS